MMWKMNERCCVFRLRTLVYDVRETDVGSDVGDMYPLYTTSMDLGGYARCIISFGICVDLRF